MPEFTPDDAAETSSQQPEEPSALDNALPLEPAEAPLHSQEGAPPEGTTAAPAPNKPEDTLPPEAQGEANGGPLGCCLGIMVGLLLSLSLAVLSRVYATTLAGALQGNYGLLGLLVRILMGIFAVGLAIFFGYVGWGLGKRFYREYDPPVRKRRTKSRKVGQKA